ncbi:hypothetical protein CK203_024483 [Vitis vinifera]|uniref:Uncharacterized protein n=1 Tax=Vitis vinifera TaxID=29760 RepID=A0A438IYG6_VITVI|nr:hypothetical protein CK203_024483 [Vitis vinifera]
MFGSILEASGSIVVDWSPIIEDLACVDDVHLAWKRPVSSRRAEGCVPPEGSQFRSRLSLESHSWRRVGGRLIRADSYLSSDSSVEMSDELLPHLLPSRSSWLESVDAWIR